YVHPSWKNERLGETAAAWYEREITIPESWRDRRIALVAEYVNSRAGVYVDGKPAGAMLFPTGGIELTPVCRPGVKHRLSLHVEAVPLREVLLSAGDTNAPREVRGRVARRGLCGDVFLVSTPQGARVADLKVETSVPKSEVRFDVSLPGLGNDSSY